MAATRWIKVVFPGGPILKAEWCYTQQSPQGGQCFWVMQSVHSLMVHNTQTHPETTYLSPPGQLTAVATVPWPSTGPAPRWPPAGHCLPGAGRNQSAHASDGLLPHWPAWPPAGRSASTDHREQSTAQSWLLLMRQRGTPRIWEEGQLRKTNTVTGNYLSVSLSSEQWKQRKFTSVCWTAKQTVAVHSLQLAQELLFG